MVYRFPKQKLVYGPRQIDARIDQEAEISKQLSLWNQRGSQAIRGNLLAIPIEKSILYVQPLYLAAEKGQLPELKRVIVAFGNSLAMEETLELALQRLFGGEMIKEKEAPKTAALQVPARGKTEQQMAAEALAHYRKAQELLRQGNWAGYPRLGHAWSVFVGQPLTLTVPPEVEASAMAAARAGDLAAAMRAVSAPVREALAQAARGEAAERGDIYNGGAALSEGALEAFLASVGRSRTVRRAEVPLQRIPEELRRRWFFGNGPETLVACFHLDGRLAEVFRYAGKGAFKGIGDVPVWELCAETGAGVTLAGAVFRG